MIVGGIVDMSKNDEEITMYVDRNTEKIIKDIVDLLSGELYDISSEVMEEYNEELKDNLWEVKDKINSLQKITEITSKKAKSQEELNIALKEKLAFLTELNSKVNKIFSQVKETEVISNKLDKVKSELSLLEEDSNKLLENNNDLKDKIKNTDERVVTKLSNSNQKIMSEIKKTEQNLYLSIKEDIDNLIESIDNKLLSELKKIVNKVKILEEKSSENNKLLSDNKREIKDLKEAQAELKELKIKEEKIEKLPGIFKFFLGSNATLWIAEKIGL